MANRYYIANKISFIRGYGELVNMPDSATHMKHSDAQQFLLTHPENCIISHGNSSKKKFIISTKQEFLSEDKSVVSSFRKAKAFESVQDAFDFLDSIENIKELLSQPTVIDNSYRKYKRPIQEVRSKKLNTSERITLPSSIKQQVKKNYNNICQICGKPIVNDDCTIDHIIPLSRGGTNNIDNLRPVHLNCNNMKGNMTDDELLYNVTNMACRYLYYSPNSDMSAMIIRSIVRGTIKAYSDKHCFGI